MPPELYQKCTELSLKLSDALMDAIESKDPYTRVMLKEQLKVYLAVDADGSLPEQGWAAMVRDRKTAEGRKTADEPYLGIQV